MSSEVCERCPHGRHLGECPVEVVKSGVTTDCGCFTTHGSVPDVKTLRRQDAAQLRAVEKARRDRQPLHRREGPGVPLEVYSSIGYVERAGDLLPWDDGYEDGGT